MKNSLKTLLFFSIFLALLTSITYATESLGMGDAITVSVIRAAASSPKCGDTITENTVLDHDLLNCTGNGLTIGVNNTTLDCQGHLINGTGTGNGIYDVAANNTIKNCIITNFYEGIYLYYAPNSIVFNNTANSNNDTGIELQSSNNNTLFNNTANSNRNGISLELYSTNNIVFNNTANSNNYVGIEIWWYSSNNVVFNNTATSSTHGIALWSYSNNNMIFNNTISSNTWNGISIYDYSINNTIFNNTANSNYVGINLYINCSNNTISNNTANSNYYGVEIYNNSNYNEILNNNLEYNYQGFHIESSFNNTINNSIACNNTNLDFSVNNSSGNSGNNNKCDKPDGWNDTGFAGCKYTCTLCTAESCDLQDGCYAYQTGCEDRDYFCQVTGCNYTFSNRNTYSYDAYINYCSANTIRTHRTFHDFYCDASCLDHTSFVNDSLVQDCSSQNGWYNTTTTRWVNATPSTEKEQVRQESRDYACDNANCIYSVNDTSWIDTGKTRNKAVVTYCSVATNSPWSEYITKVSLNGGSKSSGRSTYSNFTNTTLTALNVGTLYNLSVDVSTSGSYTEYVKAWIDFNNDGIFSSDEEINLGSAKFYGNHTFNKTFTVPINATAGETRMRVYLKWAGAPSPCENASFGEVEDYKVNIL